MIDFQPIHPERASCVKMSGGGGEEEEVRTEEEVA